MSFSNGELYENEKEHFKPLMDEGFIVKVCLPDSGEDVYAITHPKAPGKRRDVFKPYPFSKHTEVDVDTLKKEFGLV